MEGVFGVGFGGFVVCNVDVDYGVGGDVGRKKNGGEFDFGVRVSLGIGE